MAEKSGAAKLGIKPGFVVVAHNAPEDYLDILGELPAAATVTDEPEAAPDLLHLFSTTLEELRKNLTERLPDVPDTTVVWLSYPKGGTKRELNRTIVMDEAVEVGWKAVYGVSLDDGWSANRIKRA
ncbi:MULTISPECIES: hypothetical protein [Nocardiopsis]|uniref:DUF3052 domain-containing protein n=1 Tax=Nocardiopsis lambiniae TaxID=3075539 RepID=A0ABU2M9W1_9ACTN|nr:MULTISPECIES: hypothetical protein [unclassified Nocardiopsis]MDE3723231.1 hypothetical protein [Nocardiopsis sp. N85]MDT0329464.1 hypothetical protein [Nocardiopsis sp. DSM 44743]